MTDVSIDIMTDKKRRPRDKLNDSLISKTANRIAGQVVTTKQLKPRDKIARLGDDVLQGLWITLTAKGSKTWSLQCRNAHGQVRTYTIGKYPGVGIAKARLLARSMREDIRKGDDPTNAKRERKLAREKLEQAKRDSHTLRSLMDLYERQKANSLKSWPQARGQALSFFRDFADRSLLDLSVTELQAFVDDYPKKQMARVATGVVRPVFVWGSERRYCSEEFTKLKSDIKPNKRKRYLNAQELAQILPVLRTRRGNGFHDLLTFLLLTGLRREEAATLMFDQIDWRARTIRFAPHQTKNKEEHIAPLSRQAYELLEFRRDLQLPTQLVFCNTVHRHLNDWDKQTKRLFAHTNTSNWTRHDCRRTFTTMLGELGELPHVIKSALNHVNIMDQVDMIYNRARYRPEVANAVQALANWYDAIETGQPCNQNVVALRVA